MYDFRRKLRGKPLAETIGISTHIILGGSEQDEEHSTLQFQIGVDIRYYVGHIRRINCREATRH